MMIWFETGQNTSFRVVLNTISCLQTPYTKNPPGFLSPHEKRYFLKVSFNFKWKFHNLVNTCWPNFLSLKSTKSPLQNPIFSFFISLMVVEISWLLFQNTAISGFQITTFTCSIRIESGYISKRSFKEVHKLGHIGCVMESVWTL